MFLAKEKALYTNLNMMQWQNQMFTGFFWAPVDDEAEIQSTVAEFSAVRMNAFENHNICPPTYFRLNDMTFPFQYIVDTYAVPKYREGNPAVITIITYPFLFGMMFGDIGHGSLWLMVGIGMCLVSDRVRGTSLEGMNSVRYLILLMGLMATYGGFIYNEFFAIKLNLWGSCFDINNPTNLRENPVDSDYRVYRRN